MKEFKAIYGLASLFIGIIFIIYTFKFSLNCPNALDDTKIFIFQFEKSFLDESNTLVDKLGFLFSIASKPHPKITSRLINILQYYSTGDVNFRYLKILGGLSYLLLLLIIAKTSDFKFNSKLLLSLFALFLVPTFTSYWTIFVTGFPFLIIFSYLLFHFYTKHNFHLVALFSILITYTQGSGFLACLILIFYTIIDLIKGDKTKLKFLIPPVLSISAFFLLSYESGGNNSFSSFNEIIPKSIYFLNFICFGLTKYVSTDHYTLFSFIPGILLIIWILSSLYKLIISNKSASNKYLMECSFLFLAILTASIFRTSNQDLFHNIIPRYEMYSITLLSFLLLFFYSKDSSDSKTHVYIANSLLVIILILYPIRLIKNVKFQDKTYLDKLKKTYHRQLGSDKHYVKNLETKYLSNDIYKPNYSKLESKRDLILKLGKLELISNKKITHKTHRIDSIVNVEVLIPRSLKEKTPPKLVLIDNSNNIYGCFGERIYDNRRSETDKNKIMYRYWVDATEFQKEQSFTLLFEEDKYINIDKTILKI